MRKKRVDFLPGGTVEFKLPYRNEGFHWTDIFVSHTSADAYFIDDELTSIAKEAGLGVGYLNKNMQRSEGSQVWEVYKANILRMINGCTFVVILLSPRSVKSEWVRFEVNWALDHKRPEFIIPVMLESCRINRFSRRLARMPLIDFSTEGNEARRLLAERLKRKSG